MTNPLSPAFILFLLSLTASVVVALSWYDTPPPKHRSIKQQYEDWLMRFNRTYSSRSERHRRYGIYKFNIKHIDHFNSLDLPFTRADNKFTDLSNHEFRETYLGYRKSHEHMPKHRVRNRSANETAGCLSTYLPATVDWRSRGAVTPVKDQGECVAAVDGITKICTKKLPSLSEQEILDCDANKDNRGCNGGLMDRAFLFIKQNHGIATESDYPYSASKGVCDTPMANKHTASINGFREVARNDKYSLQATVAGQPVSVAIDAGSIEFQLYSRGIFTHHCGTKLNHGVTAVGYGAEGRRRYWIVKNSWGRNWGEESYVRIEKDIRDRRGGCSIAMQASYPVKA